MDLGGKAGERRSKNKMVYPTFYFASSVLVNCLTKVVNLSFACIVDNFFGSITVVLILHLSDMC